MIVPDMHIESLYYGVIIAVVLLPVQWVLEMIFKMSNKVVRITNISIITSKKQYIMIGYYLSFFIGKFL